MINIYIILNDISYIGMRILRSVNIIVLVLNGKLQMVQNDKCRIYLVRLYFILFLQRSYIYYTVYEDRVTRKKPLASSKAFPRSLEHATPII